MKPTCADTKQLAREIARWMSGGRQWTVDQLGIPDADYDVARLDESDLHPATVANITRALRAIVR